MPLLGRGDSGFESRRSDKMNQENKGFIGNISNFFEKLEIKIRSHLSHYPIIYTIVGGIAIVLFWRGIWHTADILQDQGGVVGFIFSPVISTIIVAVVLLMTGLFVSYFIGDTILMSGIKGEKRTAEKTLRDVEEEEMKIKELRSTIKDMKKEVDEIKEVVEHEHIEHHHQVDKGRDSSQMH